MANRHDRRRQRKLKRSRDATPEEIFPEGPGGGHYPVRPEIVDRMTVAMDRLREEFPGYELTVFIAETHDQVAGARLPHFNYMSTANREDMLAVLEAFVAKNRRDGSVLDQINNPPATSSVQ